MIANTSARGTAPILKFDLCQLMGWNWGNEGFRRLVHGRPSPTYTPYLWLWRPRAGKRVVAHHALCLPRGWVPRLRGEGAGEDDFYCASWGCETLSPWKEVDREIRFKRIVRTGAPDQAGTCALGDCNPVEVKVNSWTEQSWVSGKTWGLRLYVSGRDPGV